MSNKLTETLEYGKVYDVRVEICITSGKFLATTYLDGTKVFESENYANYTKAEGATPRTTVSHVEIASLQSSLFVARIDDVVLKAGKYSEVGLTPIPFEEEDGNDAEDEYVPNPYLAIDTRIDFETDPGITVSGAATVVRGKAQGRSRCWMLRALWDIGPCPSAIARASSASSSPLI